MLPPKKVASAHVLRSCTAVSTPFGVDVYEISWKTNKDTSIVCDKGLAGNKGRTHGACWQLLNYSFVQTFVYSSDSFACWAAR